MARPAAVSRLILHMNGVRVGAWQTGQGEDALQYDEHWLASPQARPLSLSLPLQPGNAVLRGAAVSAWFDNLLPDSQPMRERLAQRFRTRSTRAFDLLAEIGRDCVGAVQITPDGVNPGRVDRISAQPLDEAGVAQALRAAVAPAALAQRGDADEYFRISIAGAQEKTALLWHQDQWWRPSGTTPTTHILKLPLGLVGHQQLDLRDSVDNEWLCAQVLAAYGLRVARCHPLSFEGQRVLAVERFDRRWAPSGAWLLRLPQEDFCQATGTPAHARYEADGGPGMARILGLLNQSAQRARDREDFFLAQLLFCLLYAPDGHAKNFSIAMHAGGRFALTPLYDVLSAYPLLGRGARQMAPQKIKLAMALRSENTHWHLREMRRRHWLELARRAGLVAADGRPAAALIQDALDRTPAVVDRVAARLPAGFPSRVAEPILHGLLAAARRL